MTWFFPQQLLCDTLERPNLNAAHLSTHRHSVVHKSYPISGISGDLLLINIHMQQYQGDNKPNEACCQ